MTKRVEYEIQRFYQNSWNYRKYGSTVPFKCVFTVFGLVIRLGYWLLEGKVLHKGSWVATLLGTLLGVQDYKKVKFPCSIVYKKKKKIVIILERPIHSSSEKSWIYIIPLLFFASFVLSASQLFGSDNLQCFASTWARSLVWFSCSMLKKK